jgi:hypothetical protein
MTLRRTLLFTFFFLCVSAASALAAPAWGRVQDDLQLGIEWGQEPTRTESVLRISMKNVGAQSREISIGTDGSAGPVYDVKLVAVRSREPGELLVFDLNALKMQSTSIPVLKSVHLEPETTYVFEYPIKQLICIVDRKDTPLESLLRQGYSVRASFIQSAIQVQTPELAPMNR